MKKILITGGLGFIAQHLTQDLLDNDYEVVLYDNLSPQVHGPIPHINFKCLDHENVEFIRGDVRSYKDLLKAMNGVDCIIHLASETGTGQSMYEITKYNDVNTLGTANLLEILTNEKHNIQKLILSSSRAIYGEGSYHCDKCGTVSPSSRSSTQLQAKKWTPTCPTCDANITAIATKEDSNILPASIYAATKFAQEDLVRITCTSLGIDAITFRFQNVYGEGQSLQNPYTGILSIFSTRIRRNMDLPIYEDGAESRDFIHVSDIAKAVRLGVQSKLKGYNVYNVGSGHGISVLDIAQKLVQVFKGNITPHISGEYRLGDIRHCYADLTRIKKDLEFSPQVSIDEGLERFAKWVLAEPLPEDKLDLATKELKEKGLMS
ncbi:MAG: NAD-dependent epimerase/dehydratase family protein [Halobacteriovoraceae bacterium]|jgi:dTDP-L-rhamnose 4-epimerase|nr:NAD-dependent epimerase/dehydratase family protein [Halobacteriovoraceae bacterium]